MPQEDARAATDASAAAAKATEARLAAENKALKAKVDQLREECGKVRDRQIGVRCSVGGRAG